ncbi:stage II sporulation protein M [Candidatus Woesearchaeota archaeon]|nr:stage II sporulation protein M [Candidatus Woesearchaeota archaeon]
MVLEQVLSFKTIANKSYYAFGLSFAFVFIGYFVGRFFFGKTISIAMLFLCTLLLVPSLVKLLAMEEKIERKYGMKHFFKTHEKVFKIYLFVFLGILAGYLVLGAVSSDFDNNFQYQLNYLTKQEGITEASIEDFASSEVNLGFDQFLSILGANLLVLAICFILSLFYGAGAIFLIVFNASVFASFILLLFRYIGDTVSTFSGIVFLFFLHMIPEVGGFLLAAIAGGVLSYAFYKEGFMGKPFKNVARDSLLLLIVAIALIVLGAFLEIYVTRNLVFRFL